jgi:peptidyl-prolyl cis-trans isomerase SurA
VTLRAALPRVLPLALLVAAGCNTSRPAAPDARTPAKSASDSPVVAEYAGQRLTLPEFEDRYARAVGGRAAAADDSLQALQDFLSRYVDFRLKVAEAERAGLDRHPEVIAEIGEYRRNLARPYLLEQAVIEPVVRRIYQRQGQVVDASHLLITVEPGATPADTLAAFRKIAAIADSVRSGTLTFEQAARRHSDDPSARSGAQGAGGRLGYFTAGQMVDAFEDAAYTAPVGQLSPVVRTSYGYHVLLVHDRRTAPQDRRLAHVMVVPEAGTDSALAAARAEAQSVLDSARAGVDFAALAERHSEDTGSAPRGGELGWLAYSIPVPEPFKSTAFALGQPGDLSEVIQTSYGFHVIKYLETRPRPTFEQAYTELKPMAARLERARVLQDSLAERALDSLRVQWRTDALTSVFATVPSDSIAQRLVTGTFPEAARALPVLIIEDSTYTLDDLSTFAAAQRLALDGDARAQAEAVLRPFARERAIDALAGGLESRDAEFARTMRDFRDGIVLFRLMEDSVWTAARRDTAALRRLYLQRRDTLLFPQRFRLVTFESTNDSVLASIAMRANSGTPLASLVSQFRHTSTTGVHVDTVLTQGATRTVLDRALGLPPGSAAGPFPYRNITQVVVVADGDEQPRYKTFEEARPELETALQAILEERLIARLRAQARVRLYPERLAGAYDGAASGQ